MVDSAASPLLVTEKAAATLIGVTASMLVAARFRKQPLLPFVRVGKRAIRYRMSDISHFIDCNTERPPPVQTGVAHELGNADDQPVRQRSRSTTTSQE